MDKIEFLHERLFTILHENIDNDNFNTDKGIDNPSFEMRGIKFLVNDVCLIANRGSKFAAIKCPLDLVRLF